MLNIIFDKIDNNIELSKEEIIFLLSLTKNGEIEQLLKKAYQIQLFEVGRNVYYRGIIEFSNICSKDCYYCGIRKSNKDVERFILPEESILNSSKFAYESRYGSIVLQSGERSNPKFVNFIEDILKKIKDISNNKLGITLSVGEQTEETYRRWFKAGAHRYLLRIETSNRDLYKRLHPKSHDYDARVSCLKSLKKVGYQVGTGVMIKLPTQTIEQLADDIIFFKTMDIDMIGMGPYLPHKSSLLTKQYPGQPNMDELLNLSLKMIAVTRIYLRNVNIAATTALQAIHPKGRENGLLAGANVIMPNLTDTKFRAPYQLYDNKPCIDENSKMCSACLSSRISGIGETIGLGEWGDSPHYKYRIKS